MSITSLNVSINLSIILKGDNPLQYYNTMFSLQYLNEYADAVVYTNNDILSMSSFSNQSDSRTSSFDHMNEQIAQDIASIFFPLRNKSCFTDQSMGQFISTLCPLKRLRFIRIGSSSQPTPGSIVNSKKQAASSTPLGWDILTKKAIDRLGIERGSGHVAFAAQVTVRGYDGAAQTNKDIQTSFFKYNKATTPWHPSSNTTAFSERPMAHTYRSVALAVNRSEMSSVVRHVSRMAAIKFHSRAYLHSYKRYGINEDDFAEAFESMSNIVAAYDEILPPSADI